MGSSAVVAIKFHHLLLIVVISVSVITANPASLPRAEITPPAEVADPAVTTERITTTTASPAAVTTIVAAAQETTQDGPAPTVQAENRTEPPVVSDTDSDKEPSKGQVSFDQRQHGRFNIRADLDNFMIILLPQSSTKSPLLSLGALGGGSPANSFGSMSGSSLFDLFTRRAATKRVSPSRRKYKVKSTMKRKYKEMLKKQAAEEKDAAAAAAVKVAEEEAANKQPVAAPEVNAIKVHEEVPLKKFDTDFTSQGEIEERTSSVSFDKPIQDKYRMDTLEKIQHQLDILIKRVDAREANFDRSSKDHFIEGRTPYRVEISSLTNEPEPRVDILPSPQHPIPFRQFRTERPLEIGGHGPQPKFFQPWTFPSGPAPGDNSMNPFGQRGPPVMVAFRDGRSLPPPPTVDGNDLRRNAILAVPFHSLGFARAMDVEYDDNPSSSSSSSLEILSNLTDNYGETEPCSDWKTRGGGEVGEQKDREDAKSPKDENIFDMCDYYHSLDSLKLDDVDEIETPTQTAQFNQDWDLKLLGATDDCGPDRRRDSYGVCQFVQF